MFQPIHLRIAPLVLLLTLFPAALPTQAQAQQKAQHGRGTPTPRVSHTAAPSRVSADLNELILQQMRQMPKGGGYAVTAEAAGRLRRSISTEGPTLALRPHEATPSYCSGATYLVFLKVLDTLQKQGQLELAAETLAALAVRGQADGTGVWGRWNANGPGTARFFHELKLGRNFDNFAEARPGDFMKIFWTKEVGSKERGHSVIYLGTSNDGETVHFWSSNIPDGYGEKAVPMSKIGYALFSRLEAPSRVNAAPALPRSDGYLASLLSKRSSIKEARAQSGVR